MQQRTNHFSEYIAPNSRTYRAMIQLHLGVETSRLNVSRVFELFHEMITRDITVDLSILNMLLKAAQQVNSASHALNILSYIRSKPDFKIHIKIWQLVAGICAKNGLLEEVKLLNEEIRYLRVL